MKKYKIIGNISTGAHGNVLKAIYSPVCKSDLKSNEIEKKKVYFAIKRLFIRKPNFDLSIIREIKSLQFLNNHPNIILLLDIFTQGSTISLVFPLLPLNLTILIYEYDLTEPQKARYTYMLLEGVNFCHENGIIHRDLKPANLLIDWNGVLKICDFGQARTLDQLNEDEDDEILSHQVCTRWYRSPELLYGANRYDFSIDLWSVGCIIAEILQKQPLFKGNSDIEQLCLVVKQLGKPPESWAKVMPDFNKLIISFDEKIDNKLRWDQLLFERSNNLIGVDLIKRTIKYEKRESAKQLLTHPFLNQVDHNQEEDLVKAKMIKQLLSRKIRKKYS